MTIQPRIITYKDELLPDTSVRRVYSDGRTEWRRRLPDGRVEWQDSTGFSGVDEMIDARLMKRTFSNGRVIYAQEQGYGRTAWGSGANLITINQSSFGGQVGTILAGIGAGALLGSVIWPPNFLTDEEEAGLRAAAARSSEGSSGGGDSGGDSGGWGGDDGGDSGSASDFG